MSISATDVAVVVGPFVAEAAACGVEPPVRIVEHDARAWLLLQDTDVLALDAFGDLWWVRLLGYDAQIIRAPWPEEIARMRLAIERSLAELRARGSHPAGRGRVPR